MSADSEKQELEHLQHEAEHVRPASKNHVMSYLVVLFAAAFLLMLLSYFMQQRTSEETIDSLKQSMSTMANMKSIEELQAENTALQEQITKLQGQMDSLLTDLTVAESKSEDWHLRLTDLRGEYDALTFLNQIRALYNQRKTAEAREAAALADSTLKEQGGLEQVLSEISGKMSEHDREIYDPLEAYQTIIGWLNK